MPDTTLYTEESFGILTDDDVYLDCVLVKPPDLEDDALQMLRVWVPKYPLTKASLITCARQEIIGYGRAARVAHLVFDLRGTGESEGSPGDRAFHLDLQGIRAWALERFGAINFGFLGLPLDRGQVQPIPVRPGVVFEASIYRPAVANGSEEAVNVGQEAVNVGQEAVNAGRESPPIIYLATYGNFGRRDDALCVALAQAGYTVYGVDPLRYLLHAGAGRRLSPLDLWQDGQALCQATGARPILLGQPIAAGLALFWAAGIKESSGVLAIGQTAGALQGAHIFGGGNAFNFFLGRHVYRIAPRPVLLVRQEDHALGGSQDEHGALFETCAEPKRQQCVTALTPELLLEMLAWLQNPS
jgi:hypothetical protein